MVVVVCIQIDSHCIDIDTSVQLNCRTKLHGQLGSFVSRRIFSRVIAVVGRTKAGSERASEEAEAGELAKRVRVNICAGGKGRERGSRVEQASKQTDRGKRLGLVIRPLSLSILFPKSPLPLIIAQCSHQRHGSFAPRQSTSLPRSIDLSPSVVGRDILARLCMDGVA